MVASTEMSVQTYAGFQLQGAQIFQQTDEASTGANSSTAHMPTQSPSLLLDSSEGLMLSFETESAESNIFDRSSSFHFH